MNRGRKAQGSGQTPHAGPTRRGEDVVEIGGKQLESALPIVPPAANEAREGRGSFISLWFRCSAAYARGYKTRDGTAYFARCPKCGKTITLPIGEGGTTQRSFQVSCQ
ncbi:MAG: hypothetical protein IBJ18_04350 [Phycisphaerales bacterium]|nr:hypothetical protein [Phycisphaerales bacterium]